MTEAAATAKIDILNNGEPQTGNEFAETGPDSRNESEIQQTVQLRLAWYRGILDSRLSSYRAERAWTIMLCIRKAYTLLIRLGWRGRMEFLRWVARIPIADDLGLEKYEPAIPDIFDYMPIEILAGRQFSGERIAPSQTYDVLILPIVDFDYRFQRPQHLAAQFARAGHRVFWISPTRTCEESRAYSVQQIQPRLWEVQLPARIPNLYYGVWDRHNLAAICKAILSVCRDFNLISSCIVVQLPFWRQVALEIRRELKSPILYDCMDHWDSFPEIGAFTRAEDAPLASEADVLIVSAESLLRKYSSRGLAPTLVRNAVLFDVFCRAARHEILDEFPRPIIGYFGGIAPWLDFDLICTVARERPNYTFIFVGGVGPCEDAVRKELDKLKSSPNIHLLGHKAYPEIPSLLAGFDVCAIPFRLSDVTMATDPVKLYEYFSQGKPVVATGMGELEQVRDLLYIANDAAQFADQLDSAVHEQNAVLRQRRIDFAEANSWTARYKTISREIEAALARMTIDGIPS